MTLFFWSASAVVLADENGLRWRNFRRWQGARWDEIDDYFFTISQNDGQHVNWLRFRDGQTLRLSESYWSDQIAFRVLVVERATQAKPSGWLLRGKEGTIRGRHVFAYKNPKRTERFEADEQGVHYFDGHTLHEAAWSAVLALHDPQLIFQRNILTLDTREWSASFSSALKDHLLLRAMIRQYAPQISVGRLRTPPRELLVPTERNNGKRTFHYQTRTNRRELRFALGISLGFLISGVLAGIVFREINLFTMLSSGLGLLAAIGCALGFWQYKTERIIVDRESVTQLLLFGERRVFFEEIQAIETSLERDTLVMHSGERPIRWRHSLANVAELRDEINKHLRARS